VKTSHYRFLEWIYDVKRGNAFPYSMR